MVMSMNCPKCGFAQQQNSAVCPQCGIVFAKYYKYHPREEETGEQPPVEVTVLGPSSEAYDLAGLLSIQKGLDNAPLFAGKSLVLLGLLVWSFQLIGPSIGSNAVGASFLHLVNLPFHEAGHIFFKPFGSFMASLGGTLGQLIMPALACATLLVKTRDPFGAGVCFWWFGENFLDIAPYINDARAGQLPLLGGNFGHSSPYGFHDWEYLLTETGLISLDQGIAKGSFFIGTILMIVSLGWMGWLLYQHYRVLFGQGRQAE
jgi:hypothetical protein